MSSGDDAVRDGDITAEKQPPVTSSASSIVDAEARPACFKSTLQEVLFVGTATMAIAMTSFLQGSTTVVTSYIGKDLKMTNAEITWINASSSLASGSFLLFFGRVADMFGRKHLLVASLFIFAVFSLGSSYAHTPISLDTLIGFMGLSSAAAVPPAVGILGAAYGKPSKRKNRAFACFSAGNPLGFVFGCLSSGVASKIFDWRATFRWIAIIYVVLTIIAFFTVPPDFTPREKLSMETLLRFDVIGTLLAIAGIAMFSSSLTLAGDAPQGWRTNYVIALLIVGVFLMVAFVYWEGKFKYPLMPLHVWRDKNFSLVIVILMLGFMAFSASQFWLSLFLQRVWHDSSLMVAVHLLPQVVMGIIVNIIAAFILHKVSNKLLMGIGAVSYLISFILLGVQKQHIIYWALIFPSLILVVVGADLEFNVANMYVMSSLPPHQQSIAGGIFQTVTKLCTTIGLGVTTAIYNPISKQMSPGDDPTKPYADCFWFCCASAALSVCLVPFMTIGTQGRADKNPATDTEKGIEKEKS
ncbi:MAG: hypothetical protein M1819_006829 [Sarea resinae]|nr:MAG: hypothetical protein M1819_006829 [Sarea resinae]